MSIMAAMLSLGAWAVSDLTLNPAQAVAFDSWGFDNSGAPTLVFGNWAGGGGWQFATALSQDDYCGVDFAFNATTETHVTFFIDYEGGAEQSIDVPTGSTSIKAGFAYTGGITKIGFKYGDWEDATKKDAASITITSAVVKANNTGEVVELPFADLSEPTEGYTKDAATQSITIGQYTWASYWSFDPAISSDDYEKVVVTFAEAVPVSGLTINAEVEGDASWCGTAIGNIAQGATKATAYFSELPPGASITRVGFFLGWQAETATVKIAKVELFKKLIPNSINISVDMENGSVSADPPMAVKGDIVTLTPNPAPGYQLSKIVIEAMADTGGANARTRSVPTTGGFITATKQSNGTWTFEMPDRQVFVSAIFTIKQNNTTAIEPVGVSPQDEGTWYDLRGHRVTSLHKGIYIKDGRKVVVR